MIDAYIQDGQNGGIPVSAKVGRQTIRNIPDSDDEPSFEAFQRFVEYVRSVFDTDLELCEE